MSTLGEELSVHPVTARCMAGRGVSTVEQGRAFLEPRLADLRPPRGLAGLGRAIDRLDRALADGERIGIFGDYDADGVTTAALLGGYLSALGASTEVRVARRDAGYGFG
ncbi:MAG: single-stranded-DNA-specific exonuclease RecJ, partial [Deltaproteobacteria bacterium]|nr:single-stranded-DNA-specific exonuclease RecJ [Deltaproteobacteria bacterium]